jgi:hypothetical protein
VEIAERGNHLGLQIPFTFDGIPPVNPAAAGYGFEKRESVRHALGKRRDEWRTEPLFQIVPHRHKGRVPENVQPGGPQPGDPVKRDVMDKPETDMQPQNVEKPGDLGIILLNLILQVHFADNIDTGGLSATVSGPGQGDQGIVHPVLECAPEESCGGDGDYRYTVFLSAHSLDIIPDRLDYTGRENKNRFHITAGSPADGPPEGCLTAENNILLRKSGRDQIRYQDLIVVEPGSVKEGEIMVTAPFWAMHDRCGITDTGSDGERSREGTSPEPK